MSAARMSPLSLRGLIAAGAVLALAGAGVIAAEPAAAATTITVGSFTDGDANDACTTDSVLTTASPVTLRNALCVASNTGGESTITVPAGTYALTAGALTLGSEPGTDVTLESTGGRAEIVGDGSSQLLTLDPNLVGGIEVSIDGFAFTGGRDTVFGGGAIIGGSGGVGDPDALVISDSVFTDNTSTGGTANPGGAVQFMGGDLTIVDSVFEGNGSGAASGGAVYFGVSGASGDLEITGSTFRDNSVAQAGTIPVGGGAVAYDTAGEGSTTITGNTFVDNTATGSSAFGGAIQQVSGPSTISKNVFQGNVAGAGGSAVDAANGNLTARFNSFTGNPGTAVRSAMSTIATVTNDWWGCNGGPGAAGCDAVQIAVGSTSPRLVLSASTSSATVELGSTADLTASLLTDSAGGAVSGADLSAFDGGSVAWSDVAPAGSTVAPTSSTFSSGTATTTFTAAGGGAGGATATFGSVAVPVVVNVRQTAAFTSANTATATTGSAFSFDVTAVGFPAPTVSRLSGDLPAGLALSGSGSSLTISGTPTESGAFPVVFQAVNGGLPALQTLTLKVGAAPTFTSTLAATLAEGAALDVVITTAGEPIPEITASTALPAGLSLDDDGDGTARLHGTPTGGPAEYTIGLVAENAIGSTPGSFTLTVTADSAFTSPDHATFTVGSAGEFDIAVDPGFPVHDTVILSGGPAWLSLTGAAGSQTLTGTPPVGSGGTYDLSLTIDGSTVAQDFHLTVHETPAVTAQPASVSVVEGADAVFTATASGFPAPGIQWQRFVAGSWTDIDDADETTLTFAAGIDDDGARLRAVFTSAAGEATTDEAVLTVGQVPTLVDVAPVTAPVGDALNIEITSSGLPVSALAASALPSWLSFTDAGDGTASLIGTPTLSDTGAIEVTVTADNGFGTAETTIDITVVGALPAFTGALDATVERGEELDVTLTATGVPTPTLTVVGSLPAGLALADEGDGTARLHGTPSVAPGVHSISIAAANVHGTTPATFTLTITAPPAFTSADETTFTVGQAGAFDISVDPGHPALDEVTLEGAPAWLSLTGAPGARSLVGTPPTGSGGTHEFELSIDGSTVVQSFTLTVQEAPAITAQPSAVTVLEGADAVFTATASGHPTPSVQWQRLVGGSWTDIDGETSTTLTVETTIADDGTRVRAVFTNAAGSATSDEAQLTVGQLPALATIAPISTFAGAPLTIDITATGLPASVMTADDVPAWLTFTDAGDGTATLAGTPALTDGGDVTITVTADNGFGTATTSVEISVATTVALPDELPTASDDSLTGVPDSVTRGQQFTIGGSGFLPGAEIEYGIYSEPTVLGTAVADAQGAFTAVVTIPADQSAGAHTLAATGIGAEGTPRLLTSATTVVLPPTDGGTDGAEGTGTGSGSGDGSGLATTGIDSSASVGIALLALLALLGGLLLARGARRRTV